MTAPTPPAAIELTQFADAIDNARIDNNTAVVASVTESGFPDLALKGSVMVWDADHLAWWERSQRETYAAIKANPKVAVLVRNPTRDKRSVRLYGVVSIVEDPALRERVWDRVVQIEKDADKEKKGVAVIVRVDRVRFFGGGAGGEQRR